MATSPFPEASLDAADLPAPPGWRTVCLRTAGICGAALAAQVPPVLLIGWPMAWGALLPLMGNLIVDYACVGLVVALTLYAVERVAYRPWPWRRLLLVAGLAAAVATQLLPGTGREFNTPEVNEQLQQAGLATDTHAIRLYQLWFSGILASVSAGYLMQRRGSTLAEQRRELLEAQWQQARRRVRIMRDAAGAARLDPQVLFDCLGLARSEYLRDAPSADALLDRLIDFLRSTLSGTRSGRHTLGDEVGLAMGYAAIVARPGGGPVVDAVPPGLRRQGVFPGLLLPLVQQWLAACVDTLSANQPLCIDASVEGADPGLLCLQLSGPVAELDAALAECRTRLADLYGGRATVRAAVGGSVSPQLDVRFELPLEVAHAH